MFIKKIAIKKSAAKVQKKLQIQDVCAIFKKNCNFAKKFSISYFDLYFF